MPQSNNPWARLSDSRPSAIPPPSAHHTVKKDPYKTNYILICPICYLNDDKKIELKVYKIPHYIEKLTPDGSIKIVVDKHDLQSRCHKCHSSFHNLTKKILQEKHE